MSHPRDQRDLDPEEEIERERPPTPLWRRRGVLLLVGAVIVVIAFIFTRPNRQATLSPTAQDSTIAVTQPYEKAIEPPLKVSMSMPPPALPPPQPPTLAAVKPAPAPVRPAMISYPVKVTPYPEEKLPPEPDRTKLKFNTTSLPGIKASPAIDETYMLMPGLLPCVLDVAIDSNLPGPLMCHLPGRVYSPKGVLLMEDGTQVIGKYESMKQNGVERLEAISTYAHTPNGIWVPLSAQPFSDDLGRTGLSGTLDKRLIERFGGAVLLDLTQTALGIVQANVSKGGSTYLSFNGSDQLANQILQSTINLPPIMTKNQGSTIAIWLTEPVDFSDSYRIVAKER